MAMSRKHYTTVARTLREGRELFPGDPSVQNALTDVAVGLASLFKQDNPSFDRERFMDAQRLEG